VLRALRFLITISVDALRAAASRLAFVFWNADERRPRALWRLLLQLVLFLLVSLVFASFGTLLPQTPLLAWVGQVGILVVAVFTVWVACRGLDLRPFADLGLHLNRAWWIDLVAGLVLGALLMSALFVVTVAAGWVEVHATLARSGAIRPFPLALFLLFVNHVAVGVGEEVFFRGYQLRNIAEGLNCRWIAPRGALWIAVLLTALIFATAHTNQANTPLLSWTNLTIAGLMLAVPVVYTGRLALPIGFHVAWNFFQGGVFGFPVSGSGRQVALLTVDDRGPVLWTGGDYGPEGGLLGTAALIVAVGLALAWTRLRSGALRLKRELAQYR
jgi:membrane protease YdiL (CAAX protease family)